MANSTSLGDTVQVCVDESCMSAYCDQMHKLYQIPGKVDWMFLNPRCVFPSSSSCYPECFMGRYQTNHLWKYSLICLSTLFAFA